MRGARSRVRFGSKADILRCKAMSAFPPKAEIDRLFVYVCFGRIVNTSKICLTAAAQVDCDKRTCTY
jgi:hypothetical protein